MQTKTLFGGWINQPTRTGNHSSLTKIVGYVSIVAAMAVTGTGGALTVEKFSEKLTRSRTPTVDITEAISSRTPAEDLAQIRTVLSPAISDLALTLNVTRQSIYNWINGEPVSEGNAARLRDLAQAADVLAEEGITFNATLLKRKFANGRTLLQVAQSGESARNAATMLVQILRRESEQRERMNTHFASRKKSVATADFDLPPAGEYR